MKSVLAFVLPFLLALVSPHFLLGQDDGIEIKNQQVAKEIIKELRGKNIKSTGVLKFSVRIGNEPFPSTKGAINMRLAEKLEIALALANPASSAKVDEQVGVVRSATDIANTIDGANHLTEAGRKLLFTKPYPLAWKMKDKSELVPDSLIAGVAQISEDLVRMDVELLLIKKSDGSIEPLSKFSVPTDLEDLIDAGESFSTRGFGVVKVSSKEMAEINKKQALEVRTETAGKSQPQSSTQHPLAANDSPLKFEVWYDKKLQPYEFRDGAAYVKEPIQGQDIILGIRRRANDQTRYGVLVRVNGENTLYKKRLPDQSGALWVMEPDKKVIGIAGFQIDKNNRQAFKVLSAPESKEREINYGRDVGMISVVVFRESNEAPTLKEDEEIEREAQSALKLPAETKKSRGALSESLFSQLVDNQNRHGGLIVDGESEKKKVKLTTFKRDPTPVMATSIRYYSKK